MTKCSECNTLFDRLNQGEFEDVGMGYICNKCIKDLEEERYREKGEPQEFEEAE